MVSTMTEYSARREQMLAYLGGVCVTCGETKNLQFDHKDRKTKSFDVSANWSIAWDRLVIELDKCQVFCERHHLDKSKEYGDHEGGQNRHNECPHGTVWGYSGRWKCRCDDCKLAKSLSRKRERERKISRE